MVDCSEMKIQHFLFSDSELEYLGSPVPEVDKNDDSNDDGRLFIYSLCMLFFSKELF